MLRTRVLVLLALFGAVSLAQAQAGSKPPSRKASGGNLGSPKEDDDFDLPGPAQRHVGPPQKPTEADLALLRALLWAHEPAPTEIRVIAVEDLALLGDTRALNELAHLLFDTNPAVQDASLRAITHFQAPRAEEILANVARHPTLPERLKIAAFDGLVFQRTASAREFLGQMSNNGALPPNLLNAARRAYATWSERAR